MLEKYNKLSLAMKIVSVSIGAVVVLMVSLAVFLSKYVSSALEDKAVGIIKQQTLMAVNQIKTFDDGINSAVDRISKMLTSKFEGKATLELNSLIMSGETSLPTLKIGGVVMNNNSTELDRLANITGGVNTIFVKKGNDFYRIATSLKNQSGVRMVGLPMGASYPALPNLMQGKDFVGRVVTPTGQRLIAKFVPIKDEHGEVVGSFGVSFDFTKSMQDLKAQIVNVKIGESGYIFAMDATPGENQGVFTIHPSIEGKNVISSKDSNGREFLREAIEKKNGTIVYPWVNNGETVSKEKIAAFVEFPEWNWVVVGSAYTEEMTREAVSIRNVLLVATVVIVLVLSFVVVYLSRSQISTPLETVIRFMNEIGRGNLNNSIEITSEDEIGQLQLAMQTMQTSLSGLVGEIRSVVACAEQGDFSKAINLKGKQGFGLEVGESLNALVKVTDEGLTSIAVVSQALAAGDLSKTVTRVFPGTFGATVSGMNTTVSVLNSVINEVREVVNAAAQGDFSHKMDAATKQGYAKTLAELLNRLSANANEALSDISRVSSSLAQGDLTQRIDKQYPGLFGKTASGINTTVENLKELVGNVVESVQTINTAAGEISAGNRDLSARTEEQASSLEETAASMEELTSMVRQNTDNARQADTLARSSSDIAGKGGAVVTASVQTMEDIAQSSRKISDIISVIDGIAFQTNILALNAAVEAARAGEQGRGFAVVASEVRNLALRAAGAAKEIKDLITESVDKVERGTQQAEEAGRTMEEIVSSITRVSHIIADISAASGEQSSGIEQVNTAVVQMDQVTQQNAALVEQAAAAAESMEDQARQLQQLVSSFRL